MPEEIGQDPPEERVNRILDEILLAARWQRPSLIVAIYRSEHIKDKVQEQILLKLASCGLSVFHYIVNRSHYDIPGELLEHPNHEQAVFSIHGLRWGGGRGYSNAYRALNMHREYLVQGCIKAIFWLSETEARQMPRFAPDFWAFRHQVVEFPDLPEAPVSTGRAAHNRQTGKATDLQEWCRRAKEFHALGCMEEALSDCRRAVRKYPDESAIHLQMAEIYLSMGQLPAAKTALKKAGRCGLRQGTLLKQYDRLSQEMRGKLPRPGGIAEQLT